MISYENISYNFAAGDGSRLNSVSPTPKQYLVVNGNPLLNTQ